MKSWRKTITLASPLRTVTTVGLSRTRTAAGAAAAASTPGPALVPAPAPVSAAELEAARKQGYEAGRADAERALGEQLVRQRAEVGSLASGVLESLRKAVPQVVQETEQHLVGLVLDIARKLVSEIPVTAEMVEVAVREALAEVEGASEFHVRIHPDDLELLRRTDSKLLAAGADGAQIRFHGTPEVSRGGCLVQTRFGVIDGRRETRFELLKESLLEG